MSRVFVDTSAILALLVASDQAHGNAVSAFGRLREDGAPLATTSYVLVETYALLGRRVGREAVMGFRRSFAPLLEVEWVDRPLHERGLDLLADRPHDISLVDAVSFACMRQLRIDRAFAFDRHFDREGFELI